MVLDPDLASVFQWLKQNVKPPPWRLCNSSPYLKKLWAQYDRLIVKDGLLTSLSGDSKLVSSRSSVSGCQSHVTHSTGPSEVLCQATMLMKRHWRELLGYVIGPTCQETFPPFARLALLAKHGGLWSHTSRPL